MLYFYIFSMLWCAGATVANVKRNRPGWAFVTMACTAVHFVCLILESKGLLKP